MSWGGNHTDEGGWIKWMKNPHRRVTDCMLSRIRQLGDVWFFTTPRGSHPCGACITTGLDPRSTEFYSAQRAVVAAALPIQAVTQQPQELRLHGRRGGLILHDGATVPLVVPGRGWCHYANVLHFVAAVLPIQPVLPWSLHPHRALLYSYAYATGSISNCSPVATHGYVLLVILMSDLALELVAHIRRSLPCKI
jgi:hypothetical protein